MQLDMGRRFRLKYTVYLARSLYPGKGWTNFIFLYLCSLNWRFSISFILMISIQIF